MEKVLTKDLQPDGTPLDLSALARDEVDRLRHAHPGRAVRTRVAGGLVAKGDEHLVRTVLHNLLTNPNCHYPELVPQAMPVVTADNVKEWMAKWDEAKTPEGAANAFKEPPLGCM